MLAAVAAAHSAFGGLSADLRAGLEADDEWRSRFQREEQRAAQAFRKHLRMLNSPRDCRTAPLYIFTPYAFRSGIGSVLRALANALLQASAAGRSNDQRRVPDQPQGRDPDLPRVPRRRESRRRRRLSHAGQACLLPACWPGRAFARPLQLLQLLLLLLLLLMLLMLARARARARSFLAAPGPSER